MTKGAAARMPRSWPSTYGDDLRLRPIEARREALLRLIAGVSGIVFSEALAAEGANRARLRRLQSVKRTTGTARKGKIEDAN